MRRLSAAILLLLALPFAALAACVPEEAPAEAPLERASPDAAAFADAVAVALRQHLRDIEPLSGPGAANLAIVLSSARLSLSGGAITVTRSHRGNWHIALDPDGEKIDERVFLAELEGAALFLPELIRQRRIFREVATYIATEPLVPPGPYVLRIDPTPAAGATLSLRTAQGGRAQTWTHRGYADSLRRIEAFVEGEELGGQGS